MKFLIVGCNGMAGHMISIYLKEKGHDVIGYAREKSKFVKTIIVDAADFELLKKSSYEISTACVKAIFALVHTSAIMKERLMHMF